MTKTVDEYDFSGSQGAETAQEEMKGGDFAREVEFLRLDGSQSGIAQGKNQILARFLTNMVQPPAGTAMSKFNLGWMTVASHFAPTKPKPPYVDEKRKWPARMSAGCRKDKIFVKRFNDQCYLCDTLGSKPSKRVWALAVERKEVRDNQGNILGYLDKTREVFDTDENGDFIVLSEKDGKKEYQKKEVPAYILMEQGWKNFFQVLQGQAQYHGLMSQDWLISRTGTDNNDTSYAFIRIAEQNIPAENPWGLAPQKYDLATPEVIQAVYPDMPDLRETLINRVSEETLGRYFVPGWVPEGWTPDQAKSGGGATVKTSPGTGMLMTSSPATAAPETPQSAPAAEPSSSALDALKNRVTQGAGAPAAE